MRALLNRCNLRLTGSRVASEDGVVLLWALIVTFVLMIVTTAAINVTTSNEQAFGSDERSTSALGVAEAGIAAATSTIQAAADTTTSSSNSGTLGGGGWSYVATRTQDDAADPTKFTWTITSTGTVNATTHIVRVTLSQTVLPTSQSQTVTIPASAAYGYGLFLGAAASDCTVSGSSNPNQLSGGGISTVSIYSAGSLCFSGNSTVQEPSTSTGNTLTVYAGGKLASGGQDQSVGTTAKYLKLVTAVGGCYDQNHNVAVSCSKKGSPKVNVNKSGYGSGVYANAYSSTQSPVVKPVIDTNWYTNAAPGPAHGCNGDSSYPSNNASGSPQWSAATFDHTVFDGNSTRNTSVGTIDPLHLVGNTSALSNSFDCKYYDGNGNLLGELKWTYPEGGMSSSSPGTLYINGTVFIDGNLSFASTDYAVYTGTGTIYVNGTVTFSGNAKICAQPTSGGACVGNFDNTQNLLEMVAVNASNATVGWSMAGNGTYEGIAFTNGAFNGAGGATMNGPVIADSALMAGTMNLQSTWNPPPGAPGAETTTTTTTTGADEVTWASNPGSWQQIG